MCLYKKNHFKFALKSKETGWNIAVIYKKNENRFEQVVTLDAWAGSISTSWVMSIQKQRYAIVFQQLTYLAVLQELHNLVVHKVAEIEITQKLAMVIPGEELREVVSLICCNSLSFMRSNILF